MTEKIDASLRFRHDIARSYNLYTYVATVSIAASLLCYLYADKHGFLSSFAWMTMSLSFGLLVRNHLHRSTMIEHLEKVHAAYFTPLENYLDKKQTEWQSYLWLRLLLGTGIGLLMIVTFIVGADRFWTVTLSSLFIIYILAIAILGWINFKDQLLLLDIRRSQRDQASNNPE